MDKSSGFRLVRDDGFNILLVTLLNYARRVSAASKVKSPCSINIKLDDVAVVADYLEVFFCAKDLSAFARATSYSIQSNASV